MSSMTQLKTQVIGVTDRGYRVNECHHHCTIPNHVVDVLRDLHEDLGIGYGTLAKIFSMNRYTISKICTYRRRADYATRYKTIQTRKAS